MLLLDVKLQITTRLLRSSWGNFFSFAGKYDEMGSKSGHGGGGDREGLDANIAMLEKEHEEITKVGKSQCAAQEKYVACRTATWQMLRWHRNRAAEHVHPSLFALL